MKAAAKAGIVVTLVFIVGFLSGIAAVTGFQTVRSDRPDQTVRLQSRQTRGPAVEPVQRIEAFAHELELTPAQREHFDPILLNSMDRIKNIRHRHRSEIRTVLAETRHEVRSLLDEQQSARFDEISKGMGSRREDSEYGRGLHGRRSEDTRRGSDRERRTRNGARERRFNR